MRNFERTLEKSLVNLQLFGRLYFTPRQLFYEFCRTMRSPIGLELKTAASLFGLSTIPTVFFSRKRPKNTIGLLAFNAFTLGTFAALRQIPHTLQLPISRSRFEKSLSDYLKNHRIKELLEIKQKVNFTESIPIDLTFYGLPHLLICESDEIAQMLRANQFHLQTPCGVLSLREASPLGETFQKMLSAAENPQVFYLHDASLPAYSLIPGLREKLSLKNEIPIRILGLRPVHARRLHLFAEKSVKFSDGAEPSSFDFLDDAEKKWLLQGNTAEVSAVSPVRLLRVLRRLMLGLEIPPSEWQIKLPDKNLGFM